MSTVSLASRAGGGRPWTVVGTVTGNLYLIGQAGTVTVDTRDEAALWAQGFTATLGSAPLSGTGVVDFGAFPGSTFASVSIAAVDAADPNAVLKAFIVPAATAAHSLDEHLIEAQAEQNRADAAYYSPRRPMRYWPAIRHRPATFSAASAGLSVRPARRLPNTCR